MSHIGPNEAICIKVPQVIGIGECQVLVVTRIPFPVPVFEIKEIIKKVIIDNCHVIANKVIIDGILEKDINFKTKEKEFTDEAGKRQVCGDVKHCTVFIPFECCIEVCGAQPGDFCQVEFAGVEGEKEEPIEICHEDGTFRKLLEKACVRVVIKVLRETQITVTPECPTVCPPVPAVCPKDEHS